MTREEEINKAYEQWRDDLDCSERTTWQDACKWADEHPVNPWRDASKELPIKDKDNISKAVIALTNIGYWFKGQYDYNNKDWFFSEEPETLDFEDGEFVTHWMPIPQL